MKSAGKGKINNELLKHRGEKLQELLVMLCNKVLQSGKLPEERKTSILIPLFNKGDKKITKLTIHHTQTHDKNVN